MSDHRVLESERIASLRLVRFRDAATGAAMTPEMLEIETKTGRLCHLVPSATDEAVMLGAGPARPGLGAAPPGSGPRAEPDPTATVRAWRDLTETLPGAFDGRPAVAALKPEDLLGPGAARAWTLAFSNGYRVRCGWHRGTLDISPGQGGLPDRTPP